MWEVQESKTQWDEACLRAVAVQLCHRGDKSMPQAQLKFINFFACPPLSGHFWQWKDIREPNWVGPQEAYTTVREELLDAHDIYERAMVKNEGREAVREEGVSLTLFTGRSQWSSWRRGPMKKLSPRKVKD